MQVAGNGSSGATRLVASRCRSGGLVQIKIPAINNPKIWVVTGDGPSPQRRVFWLQSALHDIDARVGGALPMSTEGPWKTLGLPGIASLALVAALINVFLQVQYGRLAWPMSLDFSYVWGSGKAWTSGQSPYGPAFTDALSSYYPDARSYASPPNWYPLSRLFALFDPKVATWLWAVVNTGFMVAASFLVVRSALRFESRFAPWARRLLPAPGTPSRTLWLGCLFAGFTIVATKAVPANVFLGQTGAITYLGLAFIVHGATFHRRAETIAGLVLLLLKPQIGLPFVIVLLFDRSIRFSVVTAVAIAGGMALPALLIGSPVDVIRDFLTNIAAYSDAERYENSPDVMSGVANLLFNAAGFRPSAFVWVGLAIAATLTGWRLSRRKIGSEFDRLIMIGSAALAVLLLVPLHTYDFVMLAAFAPLLAFARGAGLVLGTVVVFIFSRMAEVFERLYYGRINWLGPPWEAKPSWQATSLVVGTLLCLVVIVLELRRPAAPKGADVAA